MELIKSELLKLRRCQILLVGLVALALCPLVQYGSQLIVEADTEIQIMIFLHYLKMLFGETLRYSFQFHW